MNRAAEKEVMKAALCCRSHPDERYVHLLCNPGDLDLRFSRHYDSPGFDALHGKLVADSFDPALCSFNSLFSIAFALLDDMQENDLSHPFHSAGKGCYL